MALVLSLSLLTAGCLLGVGLTWLLLRAPELEPLLAEQAGLPES